MEYTELDKKTIQLVNSGDRTAFKQVFDSYFNALCAFCNKYLNNQSETEDTVQEVFVSFWEHKKDFDHINAIKAFLYTSVRNKCLNQLKRRLVRQKHESALIYELESEQFFINHVIEEDTFNRLYSEIKSLPDSSQKIMLLSLKGLKNREIAQQLDISENTVKTQKKIAYAKLRTKISGAAIAILLSL